MAVEMSSGRKCAVAVFALIALVALAAAAWRNGRAELEKFRIEHKVKVGK